MKVAAGSWSDWYVEGGESVVLLGETAARLSTLGTTIVELVVAHGGPLGIAQLVAGVVERVGVPPEGGSADDLVGEAVHVLSALGIVVLDLSPASGPGSR
jgi:hypothetical protein